MNVQLCKQKDIMKSFHDFYSQSFGLTHTTASSFVFDPPDENKITEEDNYILEQPITEQEIYEAIKQGKPNKSPGTDGLTNEFYKFFWKIIRKDLTDIFNAILNRKQLCCSQKQGIIVLIKKKENCVRAEDFRPITLLNSDYKILSRILAARIKQFLPNIIHVTQKGGVSGRTIFDAACEIRDAIEYVNHAKIKSILVSLDFKRAFDTVSHEYLFSTLLQYGFSSTFVNHIKCLYTNITSVLQINGYYSQPFQIQKSVRQGCPLSMYLFILSLNPILYQLHNQIKGINLLNGKLSTIAYADDITLLLRDDDDIKKMWDILKKYNEACGTTLNITKSSILPIGTWTDMPILAPLKTVQENKILGIYFTNKWEQTVQANWSKLVNKIKLKSQNLYTVTNDLYSRVLIIHVYLLSQLWYVSQVIPISKEHARQIQCVINWFLWKGDIFRVPVSTAIRSKADGGLGLVHVYTKCTALFLSRTHKIAENLDSFTRHWLMECQQYADINNPPNTYNIPRNLQYIRLYIHEWSYISTLLDINPKHLTRQVYETLLETLLISPEMNKNIRMINYNPTRNWENIWKNITSIHLTANIQSAWYKTVHDIYPTNQRLMKIGRQNTEICSLCDKQDTLLHRITACKNTTHVWEWITKILALWCRTSTNNFETQMITLPDFKYYPPQKHNSIIWLFGNTLYLFQEISLQIEMDEYLEILKRTRWKVYNEHNGQKLYGNYLKTF